MQSVYEGSRRLQGSGSIVSVSEYNGESIVAVSPTQLGAPYTRTQASKILAEWVEFFAAGPSPIEELHFGARTPKRLFDALAGQTQLRRLFVKWGDYDDLSALEGMSSLRALRLGGASSVRSLQSLSLLGTLTHLEIESLRHVHDLSPLASLSGLCQLELGGDWMSPRIAHVETLSWLPSMRELGYLVLHSIVVDDLDYSPLLALPKLRAVRVMETRGMTPAAEELKRCLPWHA